MPKPNYIMKDGARLKQTSSGKDRCYIIDCQGAPKHIADLREIHCFAWVCARHHRMYGR